MMMIHPIDITPAADEERTCTSPNAIPWAEATPLGNPHTQAYVHRHRTWTREDDELLMRRCTELGPKWTQIAFYFWNRSPDSIRNRYQRIHQEKNQAANGITKPPRPKRTTTLPPNQQSQRAMYTKEEDTLLIELVEQHMRDSKARVPWKNIAQQLGRARNGVRNRYMRLELVYKHNPVISALTAAIDDVDALADGLSDLDVDLDEMRADFPDV